MAEREGFEPSVPFPAHILSRDAQSATLSSLLLISKQGLHDFRSIEIGDLFVSSFHQAFSDTRTD